MVTTKRKRQLTTRGILAFLAGSAAAGLAVGPYAQAHFTFLGNQWFLIQLYGGAGLALVGAMMLTVGLWPAPPPATITPADVAFTRRTRQALPPPDVRIARAPALPTTPEDDQVRELNTRLRENQLSTQRAHVLRRTGQMDEDAYLEEVARLKSERADLEARKLSIELTRK